MVPSNCAIYSLSLAWLIYLITYSPIMTWNLCRKYSPLTAMLICPVIMIFYIDFSHNYDLKMSKIDELFLTYTEVGGHIVYVISAISASVLQVVFIILGSKPPYLHREVS